jgi:hypothetical protein
VWEALTVRETESRGNYGICMREHAGAEAILRELGALAEIEAAIVAHCRASASAPPRYAPEAIKRYLKAAGWVGEVRVPPMTADHDNRAINDRYDAWKAFDGAQGQVGVGLEIEHWEINNDLLKFLRGQARGQMVVGVIIHADPSEVAYAYEHCLRVAEPLWQDLPVLLCSPEGPGLPAYGLPPVQPRVYAPFRYPAPTVKPWRRCKFAALQPA